MLDKVLLLLLMLIGALIFALAFTYKEIEAYYNTFTIIVTMVSFFLSLWSFFKNKD
ncbi:MAG: hypothetical protein IPL26_03760 [Leptospiraceae bacterium]|nr:hypothetical protein [Leptospiraceae bacterium]